MKRMRSDPPRRLRAALLSLLLFSSPVQATLTVFACEPEWADLVHRLLPDARIDVATHARQDPHHIEARPSLIAALRRADLAVCTGASLESGWLPMLQQRAANPRVQTGEPGLFLAADHVQLIDAQPGFISPFAGDVHPEGNPHLHLDPERLARVGQALSSRLKQLLPERADEIAARHDDWQRQWAERMRQWRAQAAPLRAMPVVVQHGTFAYLWRWIGVTPLADLEPRPGIPPAPRHLQAVLDRTRAAAPVAIVTALHQDPQPARWLARQLPGQPPVLRLPATVTGVPGSQDDPGPAPDLDRLFSHLLTALVEAHARQPSTPDGKRPEPADTPPAGAP